MIFILSGILGLSVVGTLFIFDVFEPFAEARPVVITNVGLALIVSVLLLFFLLFILRRRYPGSKPSRTLLSTTLVFLISVNIGLFPATQLGLVEEVPEWQREGIRSSQNSMTVPLALDSEPISLTSYQGISFDGTSYRIPGQYSRNEFGKKPSGYISNHGNALVLAQGDGSLVLMELTGEGVIRDSAVSIPSNLDSLLDDELRKPNWFSVKGLLLDPPNIFISASEQSESEPGCWSTSVFRAKTGDFAEDATFQGLSRMELRFETFFTPKFEACSHHSDFNAHMSGGAMHSLADDSLLLSIGAYKNYKLPQDPNSQLGKILLIHSDERDSWQLKATGVRNPQNFQVLRGKLFFPEQGPEGGDELNVLDLSSPAIESYFVPNFGWPIASVGQHYNGVIKPFAPLVNSHNSVKGLEAPLYEWTRSLGLSSVATDPWRAEEGGLFLGSMGDSPDKGDKSLIRMGPSSIRPGQYEIEDILTIGLRVRDIIPLESALLVFTDEGRLLHLSTVEGDPEAG